MKELNRGSKMLKNEGSKYGSDKLRQLPLVSIIVPVYQVKAYVGECVDSLLCQTYKHLEIILVDDGSTDGSGEICDRYAKEDVRIRVIHQENHGPAAARNAGLDHAKGEYVAFVDSDDYAMPEYIEELYRLSLEYHADIAACMFLRDRQKIDILEQHYGRVRKKVSLQKAAVTDQKAELEQKVSPSIQEKKTIVSKTRKVKRQIAENREICMSSEQMLRQWHGRYKKWETVVWNKLYHRSVFEKKMEDKSETTGKNGNNDWSGNNTGNGHGIKNGKIRFPEGRKLEDVLISHRIVGNSNRIVLTTRPLYLYRTREGNLTSKMVSVVGREQNLRAQRERMRFFKERGYWRAYLNLMWGYVMHLGWFGWKAVRKK